MRRLLIIVAMAALAGWVPLAGGYRHAWNHYRAERTRSSQYYAAQAGCGAPCVAEHDRDWLGENPPPGVIRRNGW